MITATTRLSVFMVLCAAAWSACGREPEHVAPRLLTIAAALDSFPRHDSTLILSRASWITGNREHLFVLDPAERRGWRFSWDGEVEASFGAPGDGPGELRTPMHLALDAEGRVWTSDFRGNRLTAFTPDGELAEERSLPVVVASFTTVAGGGLLVPSPRPLEPLLLSQPDTTRPLAAPPALRPAEPGRGVLPTDPLRWHFASDGGQTVFVADAASGTVWRLELDGAEVTSAAAVPVPEPLLEEARAFRDRMLASIEVPGGAVLFLPIFKGLQYLPDDRLWLTATSGNMIGALLDAGGRGAATIVASSAAGEQRGLKSSLVVGDTLVALYDTRVKLYLLAEAGEDHPVWPKLW